jgi:CubicO group peptidase (beta-lactamase class C family)
MARSRDDGRTRKQEQHMTYTSPFPHSTPEAQGIPSAAIGAFVSAAERDLDALHSFILLRHGQVVAESWWEPYRPTDQHMLFSLSKSFTSSAIGMLVAEGRLSIDDPVLPFFPDDAPPRPGDKLRAMRVRHLLSMSTGHAVDTTGPMTEDPSGNWLRGFLAQPVEYEPGTHFLYNSGATYALSAIVQHLTGGRVLDYLRPRLFEPLGMANPRWDTSPQGIDTGGWGLWITTADIAAFGQLYLQQGVWQRQRLLPASWVEAATARQIANGPSPNTDWEQGYGYQFWRCRHNAYRGDGAFGQFCVVLPDQDAVLAMTSGLREMQPSLDLVWEHLLPTLGDAPLPEDAGAQEALAAQLVGRQLPTPPGQAQSPVAARVSGRRFIMAENDDRIADVCFDFAADETAIVIRNDRGEQRIACGHGSWLRGTADLGPNDASTRPAAPRQPGPWQLATSGAWTADDTYTAKIWWYETPFARTLTCRFADDRLTVEQQLNAGFGPLDPTRLEGRVA